MSVGKSVKRVDAYEKATGRARYTDDFFEGKFLVAKVLHSTIANGWVKSIDVSDAEKLPGVIKIATCMDVPDIQFRTAGHPWSTHVNHHDIADRKLLNRRVRLYGDDIAAVVAEDEVIAKRALALIKVEYDEYKPFITVEEAMAEGTTQLHDAFPKNILSHTDYELGNFEEACKEEGLKFFEGKFETQTVQHCHIENAISYAYMEKGRIVVVTSTQIPHICRRVIGQALGLPWGKVRVIKPYIGGGFGNKQEVLYEPLNAYLTTLVGGRCVKLELSREETFVSTRVRHAMTFYLKTAVRPDGRLVARKLEGYSNQGGYASHGHGLIWNATNGYRHLYQEEKALKSDIYTVYTNIASGGAMRAYGIPQMMFACESHMEDIAHGLKMDSIEFRKKNMMKLGYVDPISGIECNSNGLAECIEKGKAAFAWDDKIATYVNQSDPVRKGIGMSIFSYKTGVYPVSLETASCRIVLNQDGSVQLQLGATEIGQGADTVFTQMAAETIGLKMEDVHILSTQDTDITPFDTGAYASRQSYVSGMAVRKTAEEFKAKVLEYAHEMFNHPIYMMDIVDGDIVRKETGKIIATVGNVAEEAFYSLTHSVHITAEATNHCKTNAFSFGVCFAEVEVDIPVGKVKVLRIMNIHDSGVILNPQLAEAQVHGGMSMGLGFGLSEQLLYDAKTGKPLNGNFLDYKIPTMLDTPELEVDFVETFEMTGPYGNKSLGEPPTIPAAPALRNAIFNATGVAINRVPIMPEQLVQKFKENGLI